MGFSISGVDKIKALLNMTGVAEPSYYLVIINMPPALRSNVQQLSSSVGLGSLVGSVFGSVVSGLLSANLGFMCYAASLPGRQILTTPWTMYGARRQMPYGVGYDDLALSFVCSDTMIERGIFDLWHAFIQNSRSQYMEYYDNYVSNIIIMKLSSEMPPNLAPDALLRTMLRSVMSIYFFEEAFPATISPQELTYTSRSDYLSVDVEFVYRRWYSIATEILDTIKLAQSSMEGWTAGAGVTGPAPKDGIVPSSTAPSGIISSALGMITDLLA